MKGSRQECVGSPDKQTPHSSINAAANYNVTDNAAEDTNERELSDNDQELKQALGRFVIHGPDRHTLADESNRPIADRRANVFFGAYSDAQGNQQQLRGIVDTWHQDELVQSGVGHFAKAAADPRQLNRHRVFDRGEMSFVSRLGATVVRIAVQRYDYYNCEAAMNDEEYDEDGNIVPVKDNITITPLDPTTPHYMEYLKCFSDEDEILAKITAEDKREREAIAEQREAAQLAEKAYKDNAVVNMSNSNTAETASSDYALT